MATITVAELALDLDTDARTARKFLRSITPKESQPGKGSRWSIEKREVRALRKKFAAYLTEVDARRASREAVADAPEEGVDTEPTDAELEAIDAE